jgi:hypothetical protein
MTKFHFDLMFRSLLWVLYIFSNQKRQPSCLFFGPALPVYSIHASDHQITTFHIAEARRTYCACISYPNCMLCIDSFSLYIDPKTYIHLMQPGANCFYKLREDEGAPKTLLLHPDLEDSNVRVVMKVMNCLVKFSYWALLFYCRNTFMPICSRVTMDFD